VCNQFDICRAGEHLTLQIQAYNPPLNTKMTDETELRYVLNQNGRDLGMAFFDTSKMPKIGPNRISIKITNFDEEQVKSCLMTGLECPVTIEAVTSNPIQRANGIVKVTIPEDLQLMSQRCIAEVKTIVDKETVFH